jgi:AcrR family transcriptional regulator
MRTTKKTDTKTRIKEAAIRLFNATDALSVTTNHIAKEAGISPGNLYYHFKNKEEIIREIYKEMSGTFESFNSFESILLSDNPLASLSTMFDRYGELFWDYRFLMRDAPVLMAMDEELKALFSTNQEKRITQIAGLLKYLISEEILENIDKDEVALRARLHWFISAYWQVFAATAGKVTRESIQEAKEIVFKIHIIPFLSDKGKKMLDLLQDKRQ